MEQAQGPGGISGGQWAVWQAVFGPVGDDGLPRTVNFITGPSRSADIEQTIQYGAHGPRRLHILIIDA